MYAYVCDLVFEFMSNVYTVQGDQDFMLQNVCENAENNIISDYPVSKEKSIS